MRKTAVNPALLEGAELNNIDWYVAEKDALERITQAAADDAIQVRLEPARSR